MGDLNMQQEVRRVSKSEVLARLGSSPASRRGTSEPPALVVLDGIPTIISTYHGFDVLSTCNEGAIRDALKSWSTGFFILTSLPVLSSIRARDHIREICQTLKNAAADVGQEIEIVLMTELQEPEVATGTVAGAGSRADTMQYRRLGSSGLKVSRLILGCMTFGNPDWEGSPWVLPEAEALPLLKQAYDSGINTWETADTYSNGQSEMIIGKALTKYNIPRSKVVIMTKVYYPVLEDDPNCRPQPASNDSRLVNQMGLSRKHIFEAVEGSLRRLGTSYIDVLQLHRLDVDTSCEEIMKALHDLVQMGKVHYLGASSMYCWQFARLQYTAKMNHWTTFTSMSGLYNLLYREEEREMIPFCQAEGVGIIPWSPIARGLLTRPWSEQSDRSQKDTKTKKWFQGDQNREIADRVEAMAIAKGCTMSNLSLAWLLHKGACPIVGLNSIQRIKAASEALAIELTTAEMQHLEELYQPLAVQAM